MKNKIVIVTGATKGMGLEISKHLLGLGAKVCLVYNSDNETANKVKNDLSHLIDHFILIQADITKSSNRQIIVDQAIAKFGSIDVLVNNAGVAAKSGFLNGTEEEFDNILDVNLKAPIFLAKLVAKHMITQGKGGAIINFSSVCGHLGMGGISYDSAKAGIIRATETMANAVGQYGIRVNSISPGTHKTEMNRYHWENETDVYKGMVEATALKRAAEASEIVGTVVFLASDQSSYITGTDILVDGGYLKNVPGR